MSVEIHFFIASLQNKVETKGNEDKTKQNHTC